MVTNKPKHILIAPLDWGLGHTTRCIPLISHLTSLGHNVTVAGNASQRSFIEETFGAIDFIHLDGYNITYSKWNKWAQMGLLSQMPAISKAIASERNWLKKITLERKTDGIISDNRYGLFHEHIPSVIMTHQLQVQTGLGSIADNIVKNIHYRMLNRFSHVWVADAPGAANLGGILSHPTVVPRHTTYIGLLSRFAAATPALENNTVQEGPLVILLSGPEPQRTALSRLLWQQATAYGKETVFIEGCGTTLTPSEIPAHITWHQRLTHAQLGPILQCAGMVVCRSGYSTLMDLAALNKKAILIPTPGQTEQEYLAYRMNRQGAYYSVKQEAFDLNKALIKASAFHPESLVLGSAFDEHKEIVAQWAASL